MIKAFFFFSLSLGQLAGGVILGVALWLRHDSQTSKLLILQFEGHQAPGTFYISEYADQSPAITQGKPHVTCGGGLQGIKAAADGRWGLICGRCLPSCLTSAVFESSGIHRFLRWLRKKGCSLQMLNV